MASNNNNHKPTNQCRPSQIKRHDANRNTCARQGHPGLSHNNHACPTSSKADAATFPAETLKLLGPSRISQRPRLYLTDPRHKQHKHKCWQHLNFLSAPCAGLFCGSWKTGKFFRQQPAEIQTPETRTGPATAEPGLGPAFHRKGREQFLSSKQN